MTSGIRVGSAAATTRGLTADDFRAVGLLIAKTVFSIEDAAALAEVSEEVKRILAAHPLYPEYDF